MRRELPIPRQAESRRYPPLGKRVVAANTGSPRAANALRVATLLADEVEGKVDVFPVIDPARPEDLLEHATRRRATLVVLPLGGTEDLLSMAELEMALQAVHRAVVPVLAVAADLRGLPKNAILAIDFSDASARAASAATRLLAPTGTATLMHVHASGNGSNEGDGWGELLARGARRRLDLMQRRVEATSECHVDVLLSDGDPAHEILTAATLMRADLVALGGGSRGMLHRMLASSLTTRVIRGASCSVLVAPEVERAASGRPSALRRHRDRR